MCKPQYYDVVHKNLNVHMQMHHAVNKQKAFMQYFNLYHALRNIGVKVDYVEPQPGLVDMVFAANGALIDPTSNTAIVSNFSAEPRKSESVYWNKFLRSNGYNLKTTITTFEGQGDALFSHNNTKLWTGYGFRSSFAASAEIQEYLPHVQIIPLKLIDPNFYHLDTCFSVLNHDTILYYPKAFDENSNEIIRNHFRNCINVSYSDAMNFVCNSLEYDNFVITHKCSLSLKTELLNHNFKIIEMNMSEYLLSGGSVKCCVMIR